MQTIYRIFPYGGGWTVTCGEEARGPYRTAEMACQLAVSFMRMRQHPEEAARLLFEDDAGAVTQLWPRVEEPKPLSGSRAPWTVYSRPLEAGGARRPSCSVSRRSTPASIRQSSIAR